MLKLDEYDLQEKLFEQHNMVAYRVTRHADGKRFILKTFAEDYVAPQNIVAFQQEIELIKKLNHPTIIKVLELTKIDNKLALILEDSNSITLKEYLSHNKITLDQFFQIALQLARTISELHRKKIIHKNINPQNILIDEKNLAIKIIDFNIAVESSYDMQEGVYPTNLEGTLPYISPEQTGRLHRILDYRTDFYSLGVTCYELLTGEVPFQLDDPLDLIHAHITKYPLDISTIDSTIPIVVNKMIAKLMAKDPEDRYLSMEGFEYDLLECKRQYELTKTIQEFQIGTQDYNEKLTISHKLYGREEEIKTLLSIFGRIAKHKAELMIISGYAGIGKTALVNEVQKPIIHSHGYFISGKFDHLMRSTPYSAIINAFSDLIKQILTEPEDTIIQVKRELQAALGMSAKVISDVIPEIEYIIGKQIDVTDLNPNEAQNRFEYLFQNFVRVFAHANRQLVIFLDDLQWADNASLKLIDLLLTDPRAGNLLIIGTYRSNEISAEHPLMIHLEALGKERVPITHLNLLPLYRENVNQLVADTLHYSTDEVVELSNIIYNKTQGNPFFIGEFLKNMKSEGCLTFSSTEKKWQWDVNQIALGNLTNNVVDLLLHKIKQLPSELKLILQYAACLGNTFTLYNLVLISNKTAHEVSLNLWDAIQNDLIIPTSDNYKRTMAHAIGVVPPETLKKVTYKFLHDRVHQAAYITLSDKEKQQIHLKLAHMLLKEKPLNKDDENLFEVLDHYNQAIAWVTSPDEKRQLAEYNLWAGIRAKASTAYQAAMQYLSAGIALLDLSSWKKEYELTFSLYKELAECSHLVGQPTTALHYFDLLLEKANNTFDKVSIYELQINLYGTTARYEEALNIGLKALNLYGINPPIHPSKLNIMFAILKVRLQVGLKKPSDIELQEMNDPLQLAISKLISVVCNIAYLHNLPLFIVLGCKMLSMTFKYGYSRYSNLAAMAYALIFINGLYLYPSGYEYVLLSRKFARQSYYYPIVARTFSGYGFLLSHWRHPIVTNLNYILRNYQATLEVGDLVYAKYNLGYYANLLFDLGRPLPELEAATQNYLHFIASLKSQAFYVFYKKLGDFSRYFQDNNAVKYRDLITFDTNIQTNENKTEICYLYFLVNRIEYLSGNYKQALIAAEKSEEYDEATRGLLINAKNKLFYGLTLAACYADVNTSLRRQYLRKIKKIQSLLARWKDWCPANFCTDYWLITAELARLKNDNHNAVDYYNRAIEAALAANYTHLAAIANECAARFYQQIGNEKVHQFHLLEAYNAYLAWGAKTKCTELREQIKSAPTVIVT